MAITTANATYIGTGPSVDQQALAFGGTSVQEGVIIGNATVTGDGASSTFDVNYIDGTAALPFTPSAVLAFRVGGAATATISVVSVTSPTNKKFTVNTSAAVNAATFIILFVVFK